MKITIYKVTCTKAFHSAELGTGWALEPWSGDTEYYEGYDEGPDVRVLPEGYTYELANSGTMELYDPNGIRTELVSEYGQPAVVTPQGGCLPLKRFKK